MENNSDDLRWINFFERQGNGEIQYNPNSYFVDAPVQEGSSQPVQLVTPTEQQVEMAKSELKRTIKKIKPKRKPIRRKPKPQKGGKKVKRLQKKKRTAKSQTGGKKRKRKPAKKGYKRSKH